MNILSLYNKMETLENRILALSFQPQTERTSQLIDEYKEEKRKLRKQIICVVGEEGLTLLLYQNKIDGLAYNMVCEKTKLSLQKVQKGNWALKKHGIDLNIKSAKEIILEKILNNEEISYLELKSQTGASLASLRHYVKDFRKMGYNVKVKKAKKPAPMEKKVLGSYEEIKKERGCNNWWHCM